MGLEQTQGSDRRRDGRSDASQTSLRPDTADDSAERPRPKRLQITITKVEAILNG
jgi:hypothetical protein